MGITIENCKKRLVIEKELAIKTGLNHDANGTLADAIDVAIETMHKYQNIQEIVENRNGKPPLTTLNRIIKVVEYGNVD